VLETPASLLPRLRRAAGLAAVLACAGPAVLTEGCGTAQTAQPRPQAGASRQAADRFLAAYARPEGRVVRTDQGGDTVSEGQAYGLLLARALAEQRAHPTYYGAAWDALGTVLLDRSPPRRC